MSLFITPSYFDLDVFVPLSPHFVCAMRVGERVGGAMEMERVEEIGEMSSTRKCMRSEFLSRLPKQDNDKNVLKISDS